MTRSARNGFSKTSKGFTLIELMIAISIIAILATIGIIMFQQARKAANNSKRKGDLNDLRKALYAFRATASTFCLKGQGQCSTAYAARVNDSQCGFKTGATPFTLPTYAGNTACTDTTSLNATLGSFIKNDRVCDPANGGSGCTNTTYATDYYINITSDDAFVLSAILDGLGTNIAGDNSDCVTSTPGLQTGYNYCIKE